MSGFTVQYFQRFDLVRIFLSCIAIVLISCTFAAADEDIPKYRYFGSGPSHALISDYPGKLKGILRNPTGINSLEVHYGEKLDSNWCLDSLVSMQKNGDMNLASVQAGIRYDLGPIPKTFITPWVGGYLTFDYIDDRSDWKPGTEGKADWDGYGLGLAWRAGLSVKVGSLTALQLSYGRSSFGALGFTEGWSGYSGNITGERYSLVLIIYAEPEEDIFLEGGMIE